MRRRKERVWTVRCMQKLPAVGLVRTTWSQAPFPGTILQVQVVLRQALARIGEAGRRFAQCLSEMHS